MKPEDPAGHESDAPAGMHLEIHRAGSLEMRLPLLGKPVIAGRVINCDLQLDHPMVSRQHARFEPASHGSWRVCDLKSHNGTRVNGAVQTDALISGGDRVDIGPFTLILRNPDRVPSGRDLNITMNARLSVSDQMVSINSLREIEPPSIAVDQLRVLNEYSRALLETSDGNARLVQLCRLMLHQKFGGLWSVVAVLNPGDSLPQARLPIEWASHSRDTGTAHLSRTLLRAANERREPVLAGNVHSAHGMGIELSIAADVMPMAAIAVPLTERVDNDGKQPLEVLYAVFPPHYGTGEWLAICSLAVQHYRHSGVVWDNIDRNLKLAAIERDLERARRVQDRLVPRDAKLAGIDLAIRFRPCHSVGGDYVDALELPGGRSLLVVADVCGKGLSAAMVAMGVHTLVHSVARQWTGLAHLADVIDAHLSENADTFITMIAMTIDPATGAVEMINAGHPPAIIVQPDGQLRRTGDNGGFPINMQPQTLEVESIQLNPGELIALFTDGCFEVSDESGDLMGVESFYQRVAPKIAGAAPDAAADEITAMLDALQGTSSFSDDRSMLVARRRN